MESLRDSVADWCLHPRKRRTFQPRRLGVSAQNRLGLLFDCRPTGNWHLELFVGHVLPIVLEEEIYELTISFASPLDSLARRSKKGACFGSFRQIIRE